MHEFLLKLLELGDEIKISSPTNKEELDNIRNRFPNHATLILSLWKETSWIGGFSIFTLLYPLLIQDESINKELLEKSYYTELISSESLLWKLDNEEFYKNFESDWMPFADDGDNVWVIDSSNTVYIVPSDIDTEVDILCNNFDLYFKQLINEFISGDFQIKKNKYEFEGVVGYTFVIVYKNTLYFEIGSSEEWEKM